MADYYSHSRTNYFHVTDEATYQKLFAGLYASDGEVKDFSKTVDGKLMHAFGANSEIRHDPYGEENEFCAFLEALQKLLPDGEAFILQEVGHEKLCYFVGYAYIVTNKEMKTIDIGDCIKVAREMGCENTTAPEY
ncbi:MAG: hypothetical protein IKA41_04885 [Bacteroidaceae bacterium]|nr:hypothetical protein [Bacteroidaceae bacterium]